MKSLTLFHSTAQVRDLNDFRDFVEHAVLTLGGNEDTAGDLVLAVNEAVTNIMLHGYGGQPGPVSLCIEMDGEEVRAVLTDTAPHFDPTHVPPPDIHLPLEDRPLGGLGVHMMRQLSDALIYEQLPQGNRLTFVKRSPVARVQA